MIEAQVPIALVLSDKPCDGLKHAQAAGIPTVTVNRREYGYQPGCGEHWNRRGFTAAVQGLLDRSKIDYVAMAGFFTILHADIFKRYGGRILNIHPTLLPAFPGATAVADALRAGAQVTGTTIHMATPTVDDASYIVRQAKVAIVPGDTVDGLWERIKQVERQLYPEVLQQIVAGVIKPEELWRSAS